MPDSGQARPPERDRRCDLHLNGGQRKYMPTLAELVDRLAIALQKSIFIPEHRGEYLEEMKLIEHDIDLVLTQKHAESGFRLGAEDVHAVLAIMLTNRAIWEGEGKARAGEAQANNELLGQLRLTHSINGQRNAAKNVLSRSAGDRVDHKIDCFASDLVKDFGNWQIFEVTR